MRETVWSDGRAASPAMAQPVVAVAYAVRMATWRATRTPPLVTVKRRRRWRTVRRGTPTLTSFLLNDCSNNKARTCRQSKQQRCAAG